MKKNLSLILAAICAASALVSCAVAPTESSLLTSSASGLADEAWLESRLGSIPDGVTVGTADSLGIDMASFEDDGYIIRTSGDETILCGKSADGLDRAVRRYVRAVKYGDAVEDVTYHEGARIERLTVAGRDISDFTVVYHPCGKPNMPNAGKTTGNAEYAAKEFVRLVREATGVELPMIADDVSYDASAPLVTFNSVEDGGEYGMTGYSYEVKDGSLRFTGSGLSAGVSNGVYLFFENECGWLNLTYGDSYLEEADHVDVPEGTAYSGDLNFDNIEYQGMLDTPYKSNNPTVSYRGMIEKACHGMQNNGFAGEDMDLSKEQICYTDEESYGIVTENVRAYIEKQLASGKRIGVDFNSVDIAQGDNSEFCQCKNCRAVLKEEVWTSGLVVRFANRLSDELNEDYPGLKYLIFAYGPTKRPPKVTKTNDSVFVTFCLDGNCYKHPLATGECFKNTWMNSLDITNDDYAEWLDGWHEMCPNMYIWYYRLDGLFTQYNMFNVLYEDFAYFRSLRIKGIMINGDTFGMGFGRMDHDIIGTMQWHPDMTRDEIAAVLARKSTEYYGEGGDEVVFELAKLISIASIRTGCDNCWYGSRIGYHRYETSIPVLGTDYKYFAEYADALEERIETLIEDAPSRETEQKCKKLSIAVLYESIPGRYYTAVDNGDTAMISHLEEIYDLFIERSVECGFDPDDYRMGVCGSPSDHQKFARTLAEESERWEQWRYLLK